MTDIIVIAGIAVAASVISSLVFITLVSRKWKGGAGQKERREA